MEQEGRSESPGSEALQVFQTHLDYVVYLLRVIFRDIEQRNGPIENLEKSLPDVTKVCAIGDALAQLTTNVDTMTKSSNEIKKYSGEFGAMLLANVQVHPYLFDWMLVMTVHICGGVPGKHIDTSRHSLSGMDGDKGEGRNIRC